MEDLGAYNKRKAEIRTYVNKLHTQCQKKYGPYNKAVFDKNPYEAYQDVEALKKEEKTCKFISTAPRQKDPQNRYYTKIQHPRECEMVKGVWDDKTINRGNKYDIGTCWASTQDKTCGQQLQDLTLLRPGVAKYDPNHAIKVVQEAARCNETPSCNWEQQTAYTYDCVVAQKQNNEQGPVDVPPEDMPLEHFEKFLEDWYINKKYKTAPETSKLEGRGDRCNGIDEEEEVLKNDILLPTLDSTEYIPFRQLDPFQTPDIFKKYMKESTFNAFKDAFRIRKKLGPIRYKALLQKNPDILEQFYFEMDKKQFDGDKRLPRKKELTKKFYPSIPQSVVNMVMKNVALKKSKKRGMLAYHSVGSGKCMKKDTPILMYDGSIKPIQDVEIGDKVMGDDSTPRTVLSLGRGEDNMFEIIPIDGSESYTVNSEHVLVLKDANNQIHHIEVKDYLQQAMSMKGFRTLIEYDQPYTPNIDPYTFGCNLTGEIPVHMLRMSIKNRKCLLAGILHNHMQPFPPALAKQIVFLARSVGVYANYVDDNLIIDYDKTLDYDITVRPVGWDKYYGFTLDGNHRYLLGDLTVTHNTCTATGVMDAFWDTDYEIIFASSIDGIASNPDFVFHKCALNLFPRFQKEPYKGSTEAQSLALIAAAFKKRGVRFLSFAKLSNRIMKVKQGKGADKDSVDLDKCILIIDEVQNLFFPLPNQKKQHAFLEAELTDPKKHPNAKVVIMTATPGTNIPEILKLINIVRDADAPEIKPFDITKPESIEHFKSCIRGLVSYFDMSADNTKFPRVIDHEPIKLPMSQHQFDRYVEAYKAVTATQKNYKALAKKNELGKYWEPARKYSNMLFNFVSDMRLEDFSSKLPYVIKNILTYPDQKHYLYSAFSSRAGYGGHGVVAIGKELEKQGYVKLSIKDAKKYNKANKLPPPGKRYILAMNSELSEEAGEPGKNLHELLKIYNHPDNKDGQLIHVMLASNKMNEGLDLKSVVHLHIFESLITMAADKQAIGRAVRYCSFAQKDRAKGEWVVHIHRYMSDKPEPIIIDLEPKREQLNREIASLEQQIEEADNKEALKDIKKATKEKEKEILKTEKLMAKHKASEEDVAKLKHELQELEDTLNLSEKMMTDGKDKIADLKSILKEKKKELKQLDKPPKNNPKEVEMIEHRIQQEAEERFKELFTVYQCMREAAVDCRLLKDFHEKTAGQKISCI